MSELLQLFVGPPVFTLAVAESLTCGRVQAAIGAIPGASAFFLGGITAYTLEQKVRHLGVDRAEAAACDCVSAALAGQMALGACRLFGSDFSAATTGFAEPSASRGIANPSAFWAIAQRGSDEGCVAIVREGFLEKPGLGRVPMQEAVTAEVIAALTNLLRDVRAGR